jgi:ABC-type branched-subunit amino acid transport system substrate-binding protein
MKYFQKKYHLSQCLLWLFILMCWITGLPAQNNSDSSIQDNPVGILDTPAYFSGPENAVLNSADHDAVKIGLFMPLAGNEPVINAAHLAVTHLNRSGGYRGIPFSVIRRWATDPWGAGSLEMIRLIYEDRVHAVIGSVDGAATHVAEQIVNKAWVPLLSPISADPTLNYINIPWIFRLPPGFKTQAELLVKDGIDELQLKKIGLITSNDHDGRIFADDMLDILKLHRLNPVFHFELPPENLNTSLIINRVRQFSPQGLITHLPPRQMACLLAALNSEFPQIYVFCPWIPGFDPHEYGDNVKYISPFDSANNDAYTVFKKEYMNTFGKVPTAGAAYTYDAFHLLAYAFEAGGLSRKALPDAIAHKIDYCGVTGRFNWDNGGGNRGNPVLESGGR